MSGKIWQDGGSVDGQPASTYEKGDRTEAVWPVDEDGQGVTPHSHIVTNDGINASYYRPAGEAPVVNDDPCQSTYTGYNMTDTSDQREVAEYEARRRRGRQPRRQSYPSHWDD